jgi:hypothetical protein
MELLDRYPLETWQFIKQAHAVRSVIQVCEEKIVED